MRFYVFNSKKVTKCDFDVIERKDLFLLLSLKLIIILITIGITAAALYFQEYIKSFLFVIIFVMGMYISLLLFRFVNYLIKYHKFKGGSIKLSKKGFEIKNKTKRNKIPADVIISLEKNVLGNLVIREKYQYHAFPISLLPKKDRKELLSNF
ncbi:MAG: hypothetical protein GY754_31685 [bacterium]|nr:hypothetical protein [bacterium]